MQSMYPLQEQRGQYWKNTLNTQLHLGRSVRIITSGLLLLHFYIISLIKDRKSEPRSVCQGHVYGSILSMGSSPKFRLAIQKPQSANVPQRWHQTGTKRLCVWSMFCFIWDMFMERYKDHHCIQINIHIFELVILKINRSNSKHNFHSNNSKNQVLIFSVNSSNMTFKFKYNLYWHI